MMNYRIKEVSLNSGWGEVIIQVKGSWGGWRNIWRRQFIAEEREYALLCAEELKEHLEAQI